MSENNLTIRPRSKTIDVPHKEQKNFEIFEHLKRKDSSPIEITPQNTPNTPYFKGISKSTQPMFEISLPPSVKVRNTKTIHLLNLM